MDLAGKPVGFKGGVIYTDLKRELFRCFMQRGDRKEKIVRFKGDRANAWEQALDTFT